MAAARFAGIYVVADTSENKVEIRDIRGDLRRIISSTEINALLPWMTFSDVADGPCAVAVSDSGRQVFIVVCGGHVAKDGQPSDAILVFDAYDNTLGVFARAEISSRSSSLPTLSAVHFKARLYLGTESDGVKVFSAGILDNVGTLVGNVQLPTQSPVRGLAVDSDLDVLYAAGTNALYRADLNSTPISFRNLGEIRDIRAITFSPHYGGQANTGLYVLAGNSLHHLPVDQARGQQTFNPSVYLSNMARKFDVAATACGRLLVAAEDGATILSDSSDTRFSFNEWMTNEFDQVIAFAKSLVLHNPMMQGWVIDADVQQGWSRFHPASPDAACWVTLALMLSDQVRNDASAEAMVRNILVRYAGLASDGIAPQKTADGMFRHWYNPANGGAMWGDEFATLSTMKITAAAARAWNYYWHDRAVRNAANAIFRQARNWGSYVRTDTGAVYFKALQAGGPDLTLLVPPFHEGILFVEQAAAFDELLRPVYGRWLNPLRWPTAQLLPGKAVVSNKAGDFQSAFVSLYSYLLQRDFRASASWRQHVENLLYSHAAWNDANGPRYFTVFSAGTTKLEWAQSGYSADSLGRHVGDVATFPSLMAFSALGNIVPVVGAYHAYRLGARQTFSSGASILYRRSNDDLSWEPNSAGLPDVILSAAGLAELLQPGVLDKILALDMVGGGFELKKDRGVFELSPVLGEWQSKDMENLDSLVHVGQGSSLHFSPQTPQLFYGMSR